MIATSIALALLCIFISATFSGMETGVYSLQRVRLQVRASSGDERAAKLLDLVGDPGRAVCTILVVNNIVNYGVAIFTGDVVEHLAAGEDGHSLTDIQLELLNTATVVPLLFIFGELVPKDLFLRYPASLVAISYPLYRAAAFSLQWIVSPLLWLMQKLMGREAQSESPLARGGIADVLTTADEAAALTSVQRDMAAQIMRLREVRVRDHMVPLKSVVAISKEDGRRGVLDAWGRSGHSRILLKSGERKGFAGFINALDVALGEPDFSLKDHLHSLPEVSANASVIDAMQGLQAAHRPLATVREGAEIIGVVFMGQIVDVLMKRFDG